MPDPQFPWILVQTGGVSMTQVTFGVLVIAAAAVITAFLLVRARDQGLPEDQRVVRDQVRGALEEGSVTKRLDAAAIRAGELDAAALATEIRRLFKQEVTAEPETIREASGEIRTAFGESWREKTEWIPSSALALGEWALAILVFGSIAVATSMIVSALGFTAGRPSVGEVLAEIGEAANTGIEWFVQALGLFPFADFLLSLGLAYGILLLEQIYQHPWVLAALMLAVANALLFLELDVDLPTNHDRTEDVTARMAAAAILGGLLVVWAVGTAVRLALDPVFALADQAWIASLLGFLVALAVIVWLLVGTTRWLGERIRRAARGVNTAHPKVVALVVLRLLASILRPVGIVATAIYVAVVLATGSLARVLGAYLTASVEVQLSIAGLALLLVTALLWELREAAPQVRQALTEWGAREQVRLGMAVKSVPYLGVVFAFLVLYGFQVPIMVATVAAALVGMGFRILVSRYVQARRRYAEREDGEVLSSSLVIGARTVNTAEGAVYLLTVADTLYAHDRLDPLVKVGVDAIEQRARGGEADATIAAWYARNLRKFGLHGFAQTYRVKTDRATGSEYLAGKLPERIRKTILTHLREQPGRRSSRDQLVDDVCGEMPDAVVRRRLAEMILAGGLREHADGTVVLKRDIWAASPSEERLQPGRSRGLAQ